jgi:hypothetical protein
LHLKRSGPSTKPYRGSSQPNPSSAIASHSPGARCSSGGTLCAIGWNCQKMPFGEAPLHGKVVSVGMLAIVMPAAFLSNARTGTDLRPKRVAPFRRCVANQNEHCQCYLSGANAATRPYTRVMGPPIITRLERSANKRHPASVFKPSFERNTPTMQNRVERQQEAKS